MRNLLDLAPIAVDLLIELFENPSGLERYQGDINNVPKETRCRTAQIIVFGEQLCNNGFAYLHNNRLVCSSAGRKLVEALYDAKDNVEWERK